VGTAVDEGNLRTFLNSVPSNQLLLGAMVGDMYATVSSNESLAQLTAAFASLGVSLPPFSATGGLQWAFVGRRGAGRATQRYAHVSQAGGARLFSAGVRPGALNRVCSGLCGGV
jgi:hypothetical protein